MNILGGNVMVEPRGIVCIFAYGEDNCFAPSSRREQRSFALHLIVRFPQNHKNDTVSYGCIRVALELQPSVRKMQPS